MIALAFHGLPPWAMALSVGAHLTAGFALGAVHFRGLWWITHLLAGGHHLLLAIGAMLGRIVVLGGLLTLISFEGAPPLLAAAAGVLLARSVVTRRIRGGTA